MGIARLVQEKKAKVGHDDEYQIHVISSVVDVDENDLEREWVQQARLCESHVHLLASVKKELAEAEAEMEVIDAEIKDHVRKHPDEYNLDKVTENSIRETLVRQKKHREANQKVIDVQHKADLLTGTVRAIDHKKTALENLVNMRGQSWYSSPKAPPDVQERMESASRKSERRKNR